MDVESVRHLANPRVRHPVRLAIRAAKTNKQVAIRRLNYGAASKYVSDKASDRKYFGTVPFVVKNRRKKSGSPI